MRAVVWAGCAAWIAGLLLWSGAAAQAQDTATGKQEMQRACVPCHSLRLVEAQRLSAAAWGKELDKMERWGAVIKDRQALLDYLAQEYSDTKAVPKPERSGDGSKGTAR